MMIWIHKLSLRGRDNSRSVSGDLDTQTLHPRTCAQWGCIFKRAASENLLIIEFSFGIRIHKRGIRCLDHNASFIAALV